MNVPKWRRVMAGFIDLCVGGLPLLLSAIGWANLIASFAEAGLAGLLLYGLPLTMFGAMSALWAFGMLRAHQGRLSLRSVGLVVAGLEYDDDVVRRAEQTPLTPRGLVLRVGATAFATLNVICTAITFAALGSVAVGLIAG